MHTSFGQLRSLLQAPVTSPHTLLELLERAWEQSPERYEHQWRPYLSSFELPPYVASSQEQAHRLARLLPEQAQFGLRLVASQESDRVVQGLRDQPWAHRLDTIALNRCRLSDRDLARGFTQGPFEGVHTLHLSSNMLGPPGAHVVGQTFRGLTQLSVGSNPLGDEGVEALMASEAAPSLRRLDVSATRLGGPGLRALCEGVTQLEHLNLSNNGLGAHALEGLGHATCAHVASLDVSDNLMDERATRALVHQRWFARVQTLDAASNHLGTDAVEWLAQAPWRPKTLGLSRNRLNAWSVHELVRAPWFGELDALDLSHNHLEDVGFGALLCAASLHTLRELNVRGISLGEEAMAHWPSGQGLEGLRRLDLSQNMIGDRGARSILRHPPPGLDTLQLNGCGLTDATALALAKCTGLGGLKRLELGANALSKRGVEALLRSTCLPEGLTLGLFGNPGAR